MNQAYKLENISRSYEDKVVLENISLEFDRGKIYALVGENGSGKSTLLDTLGLLEAPQQGKIYFNNKEVNFKNNLFSLRQKITFCMQQPHLFRTSVYDNIAYGLRTRQVLDVNKKIKDISGQFGIISLLDKKSTTLSGGEAQKIALARTFILETPIILLDEPTANLDETSIDVLNKVLLQMKQKHITVIIATHLIDNAFRLADEVITIKDKQAYPESHQNFFTGQIQAANGLKVLKLNGQVSFILATDKQGQVKASIDPKEIIISKEKFESSARNCLKGRVSSIID
ncbi:MAG: energy-coupling factor ABC transporter ATP-binding protein, partial [Candidatus Margulisbacteria bacterium]|nr:energy-coupling factor ABC transporter ATP-binding protein [Candidatus Margulisiibacteriota bacterium]